MSTTKRLSVRSLIPFTVALLAATAASAGSIIENRPATGITSPPGLVKLKPDLIVCKVIPQFLDLNLTNRQKMQFRVHNIGKGSSPASSVQIHLGGVNGPQAIKALNPGEFEEITYENALVWDDWDGKSSIPYTFHVDKAGLVSESNENNNVLTGALSPTVREPTRCSDGQQHSGFQVNRK